MGVNDPLIRRVVNGNFGQRIRIPHQTYEGISDRSETIHVNNNANNPHEYG